MVRGRLRLLLGVLGPAVFSDLSLFTAVQPWPSLSILLGRIEFSLFCLGVARRSSTEGRGGPWSSQGHGSSTEYKEVGCYTQQGACRDSD